MFAPVNPDASYVRLSDRVEIVEYEKFFVLNGYRYYEEFGAPGTLPLDLHCYDFSDPTILPPPIIMPDIATRFINQCVRVYRNSQRGLYMGGIVKCYEGDGKVKCFNLSHDNTPFMPNELDPTILDIRFNSSLILDGNFEFTLYLAKEII